MVCGDKELTIVSLFPDTY